MHKPSVISDSYALPGMLLNLCSNPLGDVQMTIVFFDPLKQPGWDNPNLKPALFPQALNSVDHLLYSPYLINAGELLLMCALWDGPRDHDLLLCEVQPAGTSFWIPLYDTYFETAPTAPSVAVKIPLSVLAHGSFGLRFKVRSGDDGDYRNFSQESRMDLDFYAPYQDVAGSTQPPEADYPAELPAGVDINQATLDTNPGGFNFVIRSHIAWAAGDAITGIWFSAVAPLGSEPSLDSLPLDAVPTTFNLPVRAFEGLPNGFYRFYYQLTDFAGNKSLISVAPSGRNFQR